MKNKFKPVNKQQFQDFIDKYPVKLTWDVCGTFEPPLGSYNDFNLGDWPDSVVAKVTLNHLYDPMLHDEYYILASDNG